MLRHIYSILHLSLLLFLNSNIYLIEGTFNWLFHILNKFLKKKIGLKDGGSITLTLAYDDFSANCTKCNPGEISFKSFSCSDNPNWDDGSKIFWDQVNSVFFSVSLIYLLKFF